MRRLRYFVMLALVAQLGAACRGNVAPTEYLGSTDGADGGNSGSSSGEAPNSPGAVFYALTPAVYMNKIKTLLTGVSPTVEEVATVTADPTQLTGVIETWMQSPTYRAVMQSFFTSAFQQSLATAYDYSQNNINAAPQSATQLNLRDSFARTVLALIDQGLPFTQVATTRQFMMTTAEMSAYAFYDTQTRSDAGGAVDTTVLTHNDFHFALQQAGSQVPLQSSVNPADPNYLTFYFPGLSSLYSTNPACNKLDPFVIDATTCYQGENAVARTLWTLMQGKGFRYQQLNPSLNCYTQNVPYFMQASDTNDWRMVTVRPANNGEATTSFFDLNALRQSTALVLNTPRVGFFTTPAFLAQWNTNISNEARVTINQTLIVGLDHAFDGSDTVAIPTTAALDAVHASDPACFVCHQNLDPMRQFFRHDYTLYFSPQQDSNQTSILPTFAFADVAAVGSNIFDLGDQIAAHPRFATAWTQKLCTWANSARCLETDPEFIRVAMVFEQSNYSWPTLVKTLMASPLVTYSQSTATATTLGQITSLTRMEHLCNLLDARLALHDFCGLINALAGETNSVLTDALPSDIYSRGVVGAVLSTSPNLMYRSDLENFCAKAATTVVDAGSSPLLSSTAPSSAIAFLVANLMGLGADRAAQPTQILTAHYVAAQAAGATATQALRSTFIAACLSPYVSAIGF